MSKKLILTLASILGVFLVPSTASAISLVDATPKASILLAGSNITSPFAPIKVEEKKSEPVPKTEVVETPKVVTYTVMDGDNLSYIAEKFNVSWQRLWDKNEQLQNQNLLQVGDVITIPEISEELSSREPVSAPAYQNTYSTVSSPTLAQRGSQSVTEPNGYVWGQCTWYVKTRKPNIGGFWGNAGYSWLSNARAYGYQVSNVPIAGAIGVQSGHVVVIESVNGNGTVNLSEMNYNGGVGVLHYDTRPISSFIGFIYA